LGEDIRGPDHPPPFKPQDPPSALLLRGMKKLGAPPFWVLDTPGLQPPLPPRLTTGASLESLLRESVKARLEVRPVVPDQDAVRRAQKALRLGAKDAAFAAGYLREVGVPPEFRFSAAKVLKDQLRAEAEVDDPTASMDPRVTAAVLDLKLPHDTGELIGEARRRLAGAQLFSALLEAGFNPDNNWEEAVDASEQAMELAQVASGGDREGLSQSFSAFAGLPDEARLRRLAYLAEATAHLELLARLPDGVEPPWISGPETRECHEREMAVVQWMRADEIPAKVPALALAELSIPEGTVPEESERDLFIHLRCSVCGKEKLLMQSPTEGE
jgi:hypothetical protein